MNSEFVLVAKKESRKGGWHTQRLVPASSTERLPFSTSLSSGREKVSISMTPILQWIRGVGGWRGRGFVNVKSGYLTSSLPAMNDLARMLKYMQTEAHCLVLHEPPQWNPQKYFIRVCLHPLQQQDGQGIGG